VYWTQRAFGFGLAKIIHFSIDDKISAKLGGFINLFSEVIIIFIQRPYAGGKLI
jgi:hypothetical protein